jgi:hypothetical protein
MKMDRIQKMTEQLKSHKSKILQVYSDTYGVKEFNEDENNMMLFICQKDA